jgi:hypothetical protein
MSRVPNKRNVIENAKIRKNFTKMVEIIILLTVLFSNVSAATGPVTSFSVPSPIGHYPLTVTEDDVVESSTCEFDM